LLNESFKKQDAKEKLGVNKMAKRKREEKEEEKKEGQ
jgi:hypothetical protein